MRLQLYPFDPLAKGLIVCEVILNKNLYIDYLVKLKDIPLNAQTTSVGSVGARLYEHNCFELFVRSGDRYVEWNLAPDGQWQGHAFKDYRTPVAVDQALFRPERLQIIPTALGIEAHFRLPWQPIAKNLTKEYSLTINPTFVQETPSGREYWAPRHGDRPDFHDGLLFSAYQDV